MWSFGANSCRRWDFVVWWRLFAPKVCQESPEHATDLAMLEQIWLLRSTVHLLDGLVSLPKSWFEQPLVPLQDMSILNNLVHINFELSDYDQSELYRHRLIRSVVCTGAIASYYPNDLPLASLLEKERSNFLLNLIEMITSPHAKVII